MLPWRDLSAVRRPTRRRAGPPPKCGARAGGRRLSTQRRSCDSHLSRRTKNMASSLLFSTRTSW